MENNDLYQIVLNEIKSGIYDDDLWQEALKNNNGNIPEAENEYIEYRIAQLKEEKLSDQDLLTTERREHFKPGEKKSNKKNTVIGISVLFILIVLIVLMGYLLHDYFN